MTRYQRKLKKFINFATELASLSTCQRYTVGCIVFPEDFSIVAAIGYNGPAKGIHNNSCEGKPGECGCAHAEANAIAKLKEKGPFTMFCTRQPCVACANAIINSGAIDKFIYGQQYRDPKGTRLLMKAGIEVIGLDEIFS